MSRKDAPMWTVSRLAAHARRDSKQRLGVRQALQYIFFVLAVFSAVFVEDTISSQSLSPTIEARKSYQGASLSAKHATSHARRARRLSGTSEPYSILIVRVTPTQEYDYATVSAAFVDSVAVRLRTYFSEASGGRVLPNLTMHESVVEVDDFAMDDSTGNEHVCTLGGGTPYLPSISNAVELQVGSAYYDEFDRIVLALPYCENLRANGVAVAGIGERPGKMVWMNGGEDDEAAFASTLAHELGHTNGAGHAAFRDAEYGNAFSIMGSADELPAGHFSIGAKASFGWLDLNTNVAFLGSQTLCTDTDYCVSQGEFWIHAHDTGSAFAPDTLYGLKLYTADANKFVWVGLRNKYYNLSGALLTWSYEGADGLFGPSQLLDATSLTEDQSDAFLPVGGSFFYDFGRTGAHIRVLEANEDVSAIKVRVEYLADDLLDSSLNSLDTASCTSSVSVTSTTQLFALTLEDPSKVSFAQSCVDVADLATGVAQPGMYVYERAPAQLFTNASGNVVADAALSATNTNVGAGASFFVPFNTACSSSSCSVQVQFEPLYSGRWDLVSNMTRSEMPMYTTTLKGVQYYFVFKAAYYKSSLGGKKDLWVIQTPKTLDSPSILAYVQPAESGMLLADIGSDALAAYYSDANGAEVASSDTSFTCAETTVSGEIKDHYTSSHQDIYETVPHGTTRYHAFTSANYVLVHGGPAAGFVVRPSCETLYCATNRYWDEELSACQPCPSGLVSRADSTGADACVEPCSNLLLRATGITEKNYGADGLYVPSATQFNGAPAWVVQGAATRTRSFAIYKLAGVWVLGPSVGASNFWQILLEADVEHPMLASEDVDDFEISCTCEDLPSCAACPENTLPDPVNGTTCFTPCLSLVVEAGSEFDGTFHFTGHLHGRPRFASSSHILSATKAGAWNIREASTDATKLASHPMEPIYWPTNLTASTWTDSTTSMAATVQISCSSNSVINVESYRSWIGFANDSLAPTRLPTSSPTTNDDKFLDGIIDSFFPEPSPTKTPTQRTKSPTNSPTLRPTDAPTVRPTYAPTIRPTDTPTMRPTETSTMRPTNAPTTRPTSAPTLRPTIDLTTVSPSSAPSNASAPEIHVYTSGGTTPTAPTTSTVTSSSAESTNVFTKPVMLAVFGGLGVVGLAMLFLVVRDVRRRRSRSSQQNESSLGPHLGSPTSPRTPGSPLRPPPGLEMVPRQYGNAHFDLYGGDPYGSNQIYEYDVNPMF